MQLSENTLFADRYQFERLLGRGGFSEVWLATDQLTQLQVAVKVYAPGQGMDQDGLKEFSKELSNVYNLNHTNLIKPQHVDAWQNMPYLIMSFCKQGSCTSKTGKMEEEQIWRLIHDVAAGLAYLHAQDIIHQDIKPDNILIDNDGHYVITDFGISVQTRSTLRKSMNIANASGTTAYMAPERFSAEPTPVKASDIWSLGATVYELLTGKAPFGEIGGGLQKSGADLPTIHTQISPALRQTIALMLAPEPWDRPTAAVLTDWADNPAAIKFAIKNVKMIGSMASNSFLKISPQTFDTDPTGGEQKVYIKTEDKWTFTTDDKWINVERIGDTALCIKYGANETGENRSASINVISGARAAVISLDQKSLPKRNKKPLYISLIVAGVLAFVIGVALYNHYGIQVPKRVERLTALYIEKATGCKRFIASMSYKDEAMKLQGPVRAIAEVEDLEKAPLFAKTKLAAQSQPLQAAYLDSCRSVSQKLLQEINIEKSYLQPGEETELLRNFITKRNKVEDVISQFDSGKTAKQISEEIKQQLAK
ncbi:MAG: protein kinase [Paludibacteraceae bacterium]|nr:protein kinase [Paludibacteraceae bacterium]